MDLAWVAPCRLDVDPEGAARDRLPVVGHHGVEPRPRGDRRGEVRAVGPVAEVTQLHGDWCTGVRGQRNLRLSCTQSQDKCETTRQAL